MSDLYHILSGLCEHKGISGYRMCKETGIQPSIMTDLKMGRKKTINIETANKIAEYFGISVDYLLSGKDEKDASPPLTRKDERDIARRLEAMLGELGIADDALMFDGEPLDSETKELLRASLQAQLEMTKRLAKQKYTPKKHKK